MNFLRYLLLPTYPSINVAMLMALAASMLPAPSAADDLNIPAAACQAPYLDQAFPMRWHENYLMNPSWNRETWVICPMPFDNDALPVAFVVAAIGSYMNDASPTAPACFVSVTASYNTTQPPFRSGNNYKYTQAMPTAFVPDEPLWVAETVIDANVVASVIGPDPDFWVSTVFCKLPSGYSITSLNTGNDF